MIIGLTANMTVVYVVARRAQLQTSRNLYIVNLAFSDITLCLVCMPFTLTSILQHQWNMGSVFCKLVPLIQGTNIMVSVGTITVIAIDRYWVIVRGSAQNERRTVYVSIAIVWMLAILTTSPVAYYQVNSMTHGGGNPYSFSVFGSNENKHFGLIPISHGSNRFPKGNKIIPIKVQDY